ncbi:MAG: sulfurtransferase TusA family protein [Firmicutes bacterium]|uniref:TusA-related sulfurtransferase n=1 Tax=Melghirimyces thermohalophilus TaxID=1236220 RepID=A0A1G6L9Q6_9BACL|nr:sulfurtransferase TusA family protein [Melghirimyces thermohalophilus]MDA8352418.1 sulfurtransferase TusA family protein [Bacillota bacterium]SDC40004.1 TusA-related sulfurtransferase [Melghirimyces thermohalophilus]
MKADLVIDAKGLSCPMPIVRAKKGIDGLESGQIMKLESTDKGSLNDFRSWVKQTDHELLDVQEEGGVYTFYVKKG